MKARTNRLTEDFFSRHEELYPLRAELLRACGMLTDTFRGGGKLLICGNGGSCADADHIVGELMKSFVLKRRIPPDLAGKLRAEYGESGGLLAEKLQGALPAVSLNAHAALGSAFANDVDPALLFAQQVLGYGKPGDLLLGISTSGNAQNVCLAAMTAKSLGVRVIALTGRDGGRLAPLADCCLIAPQNETYRIQEVHLCLYHFLCLFVESELFVE